MECVVEFFYYGKETSINCKSNEKMIDINQKFEQKLFIQNK